VKKTKKRVINRIINEPGPMSSMNSNSGVLKKNSDLTYIPAISDKIAKRLTEVNESLNFGFKTYKKVSNMYTKTKFKLKDEDKV
jgi:hypothetical protein